MFLKLGATSFGGPVAHIARMQDEFVERRRWIAPERFLDLIGVVNLIPGPNSTQLAMEIGYEQGRWPGLLVAGACFITPAMIIVLALSMIYVHYGTLPQTQAVLAGTQPVVMAIVAQALARFARTALNSVLKAGVAVGMAVLLLFHIKETHALGIAALGGLLMGWVAYYREKSAQSNQPNNTIKMLSAMPFAAPVIAPTLWKLFLLFLKIGSIIYGSGYVLLAFLRDDLVQHLGWISDKELLDAIAVGQVTPGPVFTTATFVGFLVGTRYSLGPLVAACVATLGIFLPSFLLVGMLSLTVQRLRKSLVLRHFLDAVNAASVVLMAAVTLQLASHVFMTTDHTINVIASGMTLIALFILLVTRLNAMWLLLAGAAIGLVFHGR